MKLEVYGFCGILMHKDKFIYSKLFLVPQIQHETAEVINRHVKTKSKYDDSKQKHRMCRQPVLSGSPCSACMDFSDDYLAKCQFFCGRVESQTCSIHQGPLRHTPSLLQRDSHAILCFYTGFV